MNAIDTNILLYAHDPRDVRKQKIATEIIQSISNGVLLWQVANEYLSASRKLEPFGFNRSDVFKDISDFKKIWITILPSWNIIEQTESLLNRFSLSFWDAMIISASLEGKILRLYSEDFDSYKNIDGLEIINPFK